MSRRYIGLVLGLLMIFCGVAWAGQRNSLLLRSDEEVANQRSRGGQMAGRSQVPGRSFTLYGRGNYNEGMGAMEVSWMTVDIPQPKDFRVHDLITIIVNEVSKSSSKADRRSDRENTIDAKLEDWIRFTGFGIRPDKQSRGDPAIVAGIEREFKGKGWIKREDILTARIQAEIIDVLPNGNLVLEANKKVVTDDDATIVTLTGICRSRDVLADNSVISTKLAHLEVRKTHSGSARDAVKRGFITQLWDRLSPF